MQRVNGIAFCEIVKASQFFALAPLGIRYLGTSRDKLCHLDESEFHLIADETLEELVNCLDMLESSLDDFEVDLSVSHPVFFNEECTILRMLL